MDTPKEVMEAEEMFRKIHVRHRPAARRAVNRVQHFYVGRATRSQADGAMAELRVLRRMWKVI